MATAASDGFASAGRRRRGSTGVSIGLHEAGPNPSRVRTLLSLRLCPQLGGAVSLQREEARVPRRFRRYRAGTLYAPGIRPRDLARGPSIESPVGHDTRTASFGAPHHTRLVRARTNDLAGDCR